MFIKNFIETEDLLNDIIKNTMWAHIIIIIINEEYFNEIGEISCKMQIQWFKILILMWFK